MEWQMYFSAENLPEVNTVVMHYKIRRNKNQPVKHSLAWPDCFPLLFVVAERRKNGVWACEAICKGSHGERLAQLVCELARILIISSWSMNIAVFSTRNLEDKVANLVKLFIGWTNNWWSRECFLANYVNEGDSQKLSSVNDSQYTVC